MNCICKWVNIFSTFTNYDTNYLKFPLPLKKKKKKKNTGAPPVPPMINNMKTGPEGPQITNGTGPVIFKASWVG